MVSNEKVRVSDEFKELIDYIIARCALMSKRKPTASEITKVIAKKINKERLWENEFQ